MTIISFSHLPDDALLAEAHRVVAHERQATAQVIALLMELDARTATSAPSRSRNAAARSIGTTTTAQVIAI